MIPQLSVIAKLHLLLITKLSFTKNTKFKENDMKGKLTANLVFADG